MFKIDFERGVLENGPDDLSERGIGTYIADEWEAWEILLESVKRQHNRMLITLREKAKEIDKIEESLERQEQVVRAVYNNERRIELAKEHGLVITKDEEQ